MFRNLFPWSAGGQTGFVRFQYSRLVNRRGNITGNYDYSLKSSGFGSRFMAPRKKNPSTQKLGTGPVITDGDRLAPGNTTLEKQLDSRTQLGLPCLEEQRCGNTCMQVCLYARTKVCMYACRIFACLHIMCMSAWQSVCTYKQTEKHTSMHPSIHIVAYLHIYVRM